MAKHTVRLTIQPTVEIEVEGPEYLDLLRQGLVVRETPPATLDAPQPAVPAEVDAEPTEDAQEPQAASEPRPVARGRKTHNGGK